MTRPTVWLCAALALAGCKAPAPTFDPFQGQTRIAPPGTGQTLGAPPYYQPPQVTMPGPTTSGPAASPGAFPQSAPGTYTPPTYPNYQDPPANNTPPMTNPAGAWNPPGGYRPAATMAVSPPPEARVAPEHLVAAAAPLATTSAGVVNRVRQTALEVTSPEPAVRIPSDEDSKQIRRELMTRELRRLEEEQRLMERQRQASREQAQNASHSPPRQRFPQPEPVREPAHATSVAHLQPEPVPQQEFAPRPQPAPRRAVSPPLVSTQPTLLAPGYGAEHQAAASGQPSFGEPRRIVAPANAIDIASLPPAPPHPNDLSLVSKAPTLLASPGAGQPTFTTPRQTAEPREPRVETILPASAEMPAPATAPAPVRESIEPKTRYGYDPEYAWLTGKLEYSATQDAWKLRYIPIDGDTDDFGGSVAIVNPEVLAQYESGDFIAVEGSIVARPEDGRSYAPSYRIERVKSLGE